MSGRARPNEPLAARCEIGLAGCHGVPNQRHHRKRRSQGGTDDESNTLDTCSPCHDFVHAHVAWAYDHGYLVRSFADPILVSVG